MRFNHGPRVHLALVPLQDADRRSRASANHGLYVNRDQERSFSSLARSSSIIRILVPIFDSSDLNIAACLILINRQ
jgi:hypothetical protein